MAAIGSGAFAHEAEELPRGVLVNNDEELPSVMEELKELKKLIEEMESTSPVPVGSHSSSGLSQASCT